MWPFKSSEQQYDAVANDEEELKTTQSDRKRKVIGPTTVWVGILLVMAAVAVGELVFRSPHASPDVPAQERLDESPNEEAKCPQRREWRTLTAAEQQEYISAVLCLRTQPSTLTPDSNKTAYDDYPWIHSHVGYFTHNSAPFLPWHRYFLHIYESTLRNQCGYNGSLVYWDWTLDNEALEKSPVFDPTTGFGGDGEVDGEITVGRSGRCLVDGPFTNITADYYDVKYQPHCLSRGFRDLDGKLGHIDGHDISPESIEEVLSLTDYESFVTLMESRVHDAIPFGIGGDFETFTAPHDPLFFLHHTQLDRLWWLWQQRQPDKGLSAYGGHKQRHSMEMASMEDDIIMQALAPSVKVAEVMDVEGQLLCYRY
ncbi:hypothetical protein LTR56_009879 [Elasticomyces elasticus]|nr:hypothetical protein LTR56_009879 [Elasticomyces elasticus]KAK3659195.1 hypothetical protein LTR22_008658 [Elasticomyces elasticus]KAK4923129.1 hypothetical protein LTR49_009597 [Elasticomyces elasticus]KAK5761513.1 hypothetical protein LTS12_008305 [Elasticomyces elasticus]